MVEQLLGGTRLIDAVIAITVVECLALVLYHRATGRGIAVRDYGLNLLSGLLLMLALRSVLAGSPMYWMLACLAASGLAHATDLRLRWGRTRAGAAGPGPR